jgi:cytidylate kinase
MITSDPPPSPLNGGVDRGVQRRPIVTIAAYYGAGGTVIGPLVAQRLGVDFLDRGVTPGVAAALQVSAEAVESYEDHSSGISTLLGSLARVAIGTADPVARQSTGALDTGLDNDEHRYRAAIDDFLISATRSGGVALGRGGYLALQSVPGALHVMLFGPRAARVRQALSQEGIDQPTAERLLDINDTARIEYNRATYGVDPLDPKFFHLLVDSTAIDLQTCVDLIVAASQTRLLNSR